MYGKRVLPKATNLAFEQRSFVIVCMNIRFEMTVKLRNNFQKSPIKLNLSRKCMLSQNGDNEEISCYRLAHKE